MLDEAGDSEGAGPRADDVDVVALKQPLEADEDEAHSLAGSWRARDVNPRRRSVHQIQLLRRQHQKGQPPAQFRHRLAFRSHLHARWDGAVDMDCRGRPHEPAVVSINVVSGYSQACVLFFGVGGAGCGSFI